MGRSSTAVRSLPAAACVVCLGSYSVLVCICAWSLHTTVLLLPYPVLLAYLITRAVIGDPATSAYFITGKGGARTPKGAKARYQFVTMPVNHFGEKVRWCLDLINAPYEESDVGGITSAAFRGRSVPWLVDRLSCSHIGNSDHILMYMSAVHVPEMEEPARSKAEKLLTRNAGTIEWEEKLNELGHALQGWAYYYMLGPQTSGVFTLTAWGAFEPHVPFYYRVVLQSLHPVFKFVLRDKLKLSDVPVRDYRYAQITAVLDDVDAALAKTGAYILGKDLTYVDISFCALLAPMISSLAFSNQKNQWANNRFTSFEGLFERNKIGYPTEILEFEKHLLGRPCGKFVQKLYAEWRGTQF